MKPPLLLALLSVALLILAITLHFRTKESYVFKVYRVENTNASSNNFSVPHITQSSGDPISLEDIDAPFYLYKANFVPFGNLKRMMLLQSKQNPADIRFQEVAPYTYTLNPPEGFQGPLKNVPLTTIMNLAQKNNYDVFVQKPDAKLPVIIYVGNSITDGALTLSKESTQITPQDGYLTYITARGPPDLNNYSNSEGEWKYNQENTIAPNSILVNAQDWFGKSSATLPEWQYQATMRGYSILSYPMNRVYPLYPTSSASEVYVGKLEDITAKYTVNGMKKDTPITFLSETTVPFCFGYNDGKSPRRGNGKTTEDPPEQVKLDSNISLNNIMIRATATGSIQCLSDDGKNCLAGLCWNGGTCFDGQCVDEDDNPLPTIIPDDRELPQGDFHFADLIPGLDEQNQSYYQLNTEKLNYIPCPDSICKPAYYDVYITQFVALKKTALQGNYGMFVFWKRMSSEPEGLLSNIRYGDRMLETAPTFLKSKQNTMLHGLMPNRWADIDYGPGTDGAGTLMIHNNRESDFLWYMNKNYNLANLWRDGSIHYLAKTNIPNQLTYDAKKEKAIKVLMDKAGRIHDAENIESCVTVMPSFTGCSQERGKVYPFEKNKNEGSLQMQTCANSYSVQTMLKNNQMYKDDQWCIDPDRTSGYAISDQGIYNESFTKAGNHPSLLQRFFGFNPNNCNAIKNSWMSTNPNEFECNVLYDSYKACNISPDVILEAAKKCASTDKLSFFRRDQWNKLSEELTAKGYTMPDVPSINCLQAYYDNDIKCPKFDIYTKECYPHLKKLGMWDTEKELKSCKDDPSLTQPIYRNAVKNLENQSVSVPQTLQYNTIERCYPSLAFMDDANGYNSSYCNDATNIIKDCKDNISDLSKERIIALSNACINKNVWTKQQYDYAKMAFKDRYETASDFPEYVFSRNSN